MISEKHRELITKYYQAYNEKNWDLMESIIHNDLTHVKHVLTDLPYSPYEFANPWPEFLKMIKYEPNDVEDTLREYTNKTEFINWSKLIRKIIISFQINDIVVGVEKVWVSTFSTIVVPEHQNLVHNSIDRFWIKDNQIVAVLHQGRFLNTLLQYGSIIMKEDNHTEVQKYLQTLVSIGLIPKYLTK
ncbi:MAG: hypothetical protein ACXAD7_20840 [Candidatus Kariarchaeaceae archaeon]|jgi:hypothetical protein